MMPNSFDAKATLTVGERAYEIFRLDALQAKYDVARLPFSLKVLLENLLRNEDGESIRAQDIEALASWDANAEPSQEIAFTPARVLMQDFTGVPAVVDLAAMRDAMREMGGDPRQDQPARAGRAGDRPLGAGRRVRHRASRSQRNAELEFERNQERYAFLRWGQGAFDNFKVVPPDTGIVHQVNLEYLARVVFVERRAPAPGLPRHAGRHRLAHDDDQRPRRARLGRRRDRGRGGDARPADVDADPAGARLQADRRAAGGRDRHRPRADRHRDAARSAASSASSSSSTATGLARLPLADRATIGNMSPEFGSTCAIFPIDAETLRYLEFSGRPRELIELVEAYAKEQGLWHDEDSEEPTFTDQLELDLSTVVPSIAGPKRPQDRVSLTESKAGVPDGARGLPARRGRRGRGARRRASRPAIRSPRTCPTASGHEPPAAPAARRWPSAASTRDAGDARRRHRDRARPRARRDRRDHELHEHLQPVGDARRGDPGPQRGPEGAEGQAVGQDLARARARRSSPSTSTAPA